LTEPKTFAILEAIRESSRTQKGGARMTQAEQVNEAKQERTHRAQVKRMVEIRPDIPGAIWDIEASEEMAAEWDAAHGW